MVNTDKEVWMGEINKDDPAVVVTLRVPALVRDRFAAVAALSRQTMSDLLAGWVMADADRLGLPRIDGFQDTDKGKER